MQASEQIDAHIAGYTDWRGKLLAELRKLINETEPNLKEEWKWSVPVWTHNGQVCAISGFKDHVKMNFFKGAYLTDPKGLFNSGLDSKEHRSINFAEGDNVDKTAIAELIREAVAYNSK
jgi:hypothetical protein